MIKVISTFPMDNVMHNTQFPLLYYVTNRNPTYLFQCLHLKLLWHNVFEL